MTQFEVFANPVARARASYPFVVVLQADVARGGRDRAVAPVAPRAAFPAVAGRLTYNAAGAVAGIAPYRSALTRAVGATQLAVRHPRYKTSVRPRTRQ
jgi:hypothetical protein